MMGWYSPELESAAQRSRDEALAREQRAARDLIEPFVGQTIRLSDMNGYFPSGVILDIGRGQMSYAVETHGETIYPVIVKLGNHGSHTYWMTIENLKLRTSK